MIGLRVKDVLCLREDERVSGIEAMLQSRWALRTPSVMSSRFVFCCVNTRLPSGPPADNRMQSSRRRRSRRLSRNAKQSTKQTWERGGMWRENDLQNKESLEIGWPTAPLEPNPGSNIG